MWATWHLGDHKDKALPPRWSLDKPKGHLLPKSEQGKFCKSSVPPLGCPVCKHPQCFCLWQRFKRQMNGDDVSSANLSGPTLVKHSTHWVTASNHLLEHNHTVDRMHEIFRHKRKLNCASEFLVFLRSRTTRSWFAAKFFFSLTHFVRVVPELEKFNKNLTHLQIFRNVGRQASTSSLPPRLKADWKHPYM